MNSRWGGGAVGRWGVTALLISASAFAADSMPYGKLYTDGSRSRAEIALTFDDGPAASTGALLDLLKERHVVATFFVLGNSMRAHPGLVKRMIAEGHQVGLHSDTHPNFAKVPEDKRVARLKDEIARCRAEVAKEDPRPVHFMRMPYGYDRPWVKQVAREEELVLVNWTFGDDWKRLSEAEMTAQYRKVLHNGAILLMHDGGIRGSLRVVHVTSAVLDTIEQKHLKPVRLDTLLGLEKQ